jgi:hypothetical protein
MHARVDALVAPARERQPRLGGELLRQRLGERTAARRRDEQHGRRRRPAGGEHRVERLPHGLRAHDHARAPAVRAVVDGPVRVEVQVRRSCTRTSSRPRSCALPSSETPSGAEVLGEIGDDVDEHYALTAARRRRAAPRAGRPAGVVPATSTTGTIALTNGTSTSPPCRAADDQHVAVRQVEHVGDLAERRAVDERGGHATQHVVVELVLVLGRRQRAGVDLQQRLAQQLGAGAVLHALEGEDEPAVLPAGACDGDRAALRRVGVQERARREARLGVVGADLHRHLALDALGTADPADDQQVVVVRTGRSPGRPHPRQEGWAPGRRDRRRAGAGAGAPGRRRCPATRATD